MRLVVMNHVKQMQDVKGFLQQMRVMSIDTILVLSTDQTSESGTPELLTNVTLANDGISRLYQDNPLLCLQKELQKTSAKWHLGWATQTLHTTSQRGMGVLTTNRLGVIWQRIISPHIQIQVIDMGPYVVGVITVKDARLVRRSMLQRVHDLLKAQVKPVLLFGPTIFAEDLENWGWLSKSDFPQQTLGQAWEQDVWCDCGGDVTVLQKCVLPEWNSGLLIDFK
ncbi:hypothetical protein OIT44_05075 [Weissella ceti]|uniref:Uncharacterized protein n=1 Tax=Weissella ceti TaxID=759620 RepID=A0ABT3E4V9_9LACO|nr:hypothetical protein [Weissella ceti]MCW0953441.1 hypothetical protein [Weissella ceti]QVK12044.1 hypothetical protein KHQ31_07520 [Weissella ceti]